MHDRAKELEDVSKDMETMEIHINSLPDIKRINIDAETKIETDQSLISDIKTKLLSQIAEDFNRLVDPLQLHNILKEAKEKLNCLKHQSFPLTFLSEWVCFSNAKDQCEKLIKQQSEVITQLKKNMNSDFSQLFWKQMINLDGTPVDSPRINENNDIDRLTSMLESIALDDASNLLCERSKEQNADIMDSGEFVHVDLIQEPQAGNIQREEDGNNHKQNLSEQLRQLQTENVRMQTKIRLLTEEKRYIYNACKEMNELSEGITNWKTAGKYITVPETNDAMMKTMVHSIQLVLNRFIEVKTNLIKTEQQLKRKLMSIAEWTDEVRNSTEADRKELLNEIREKTAQINLYERELRKRSTINDLEPSISDLQKKNGGLRKQNFDILKENEQLKLHLSNLYHENNTRMMNIQENQAKTEALRNSLQDMKLQIIQKEQNLAAIKKEREDYQTRLSSVAGDKLTKGNPEITDLSDPNRPMKIGEKYGELYDNEWTDALECTDKIKVLFKDLPIADIEEIIIHHLYRLLKCCHEECLLLSRKQLDTISTTIANALHLETHIIIADEITKNLATSWEYVHRNEDLIKHLTKTPFFQKCVQLCWLMAIQDPVMYLSDEIKPNTVYDKTIYREFVTSGDKVRYVVWPALFLHKDGHILYKGVVEPYQYSQDCVPVFV